MKRLSLNALCLGLILIIVCAEALAEAAPDNLNAKVRIGVILPLSGDAATLGQSTKNGIELALTKLAPALRDKLLIFYEDDGLLPMNTVSAFNKLVTVNRAQLVFNVSSGTANAIAPLADQKKIPLIAIGASDPRVVAGREYVVKLFVTPEEQAKTLVPYAISRGHKSIARITSIQAGLLSQKRAFDEVNDNRIKIVLDEEYATDVKDFKTFLAKLKNRTDVDGIYALLLTGQVAIFAKQLRAMEVVTPLFGSETFEDSNEVAASDGTLVGSWYVNADDPNETFTKEYQQMFPGQSMVLASNGYDAMLMTASAVEKSSDPEEINSFFHTVKDFTGALGTYSASGKNDFTMPATIKMVDKGGFAKVDG